MLRDAQGGSGRLGSQIPSLQQVSAWMEGENSALDGWQGLENLESIRKHLKASGSIWKNPKVAMAAAARGPWCHPAAPSFSFGSFLLSSFFHQPLLLFPPSFLYSGAPSFRWGVLARSLFTSPRLSNRRCFGDSLGMLPPGFLLFFFGFLLFDVQDIPSAHFLSSFQINSMMDLIH